MLPNPSLFEITKRNLRAYRSLITPTGADAVRGRAFIEDPATPGTAKLADGTLSIAGFVTMPVKITGPTLEDMTFPNRINLPTKAGEEASFEYADMVEAEGTDYIYSGGGNTLNAATPVSTALSFIGGKWCVATSNQISEFTLTEILTPSDPTNGFRIRATRRDGVVKS